MGKGKKEKGDPPVKDGLPLVDMSRKGLIQHCVRLKEELEREREERNYYMLEREKLYSRWNLFMEQIAIEKAKVQALKGHLSDTKSSQMKEENLQESKLRFLKAEQTRKLGQVRLLHLQQMAQAQDDAWLVHMVIKEELMNKKKEIRLAQMAFYQLIRGLHWKHARQVSDLRDNFAKEIRRLESSSDRKLFDKNEQAEEQQDREKAKLATGKEEQIRFLIEDHAWQVDQMKGFFQELLRISLDIVNQMKIEVKQQTTAELTQRRDYEHFKHRYDNYVAPAMRWSSLMEEWAIAHQDDDLNELVATLNLKEEELKKRKYSLRMLEATNEALNQRIIIAEKERNCVKKQLGRAIVDSQRSASMKHFIEQLKKKAQAEGAKSISVLPSKSQQLAGAVGGDISIHDEETLGESLLNDEFPQPSSFEDEDEEETDELEWLPEEIEVLDTEDYFEGEDTEGADEMTGEMETGEETSTPEGQDVEEMGEEEETEETEEDEA